jgi:hypothetical protein
MDLRATVQSIKLAVLFISCAWQAGSTLLAQCCNSMLLPLQRSVSPACAVQRIVFKPTPVRRAQQALKVQCSSCTYWPYEPSTAHTQLQHCLSPHPASLLQRGIYSLVSIHCNHGQLLAMHFHAHLIAAVQV